MKKSAAILLSRQPLRPTCKTMWVQKTIEAMHWVKERDLYLYTSTGMNSWELLVTLARLNRVRQKILIHSENEKSFNYKCKLTIHQFDLHRESCKFVSIFPDRHIFTKKNLMYKRDKTIIENADILIPVSIRDGGQIAGLMNKYISEKTSIEYKFQVDYESRATPLNYRIPNDELSSEIVNIKNEYIIHWTRTSNSAWPNERFIDYYSAITKSEKYPRSALDTLHNIIKTKKIVATKKNMPASTYTVSFSGLSPYEIIPLIKWRTRYRQMSFEPYGIGIERNYALSSGIRPVKYYDKKQKKYAKEKDPWLTQSSGLKSDWQVEDELRHYGDFDLSSVPTDKLILFCFYENEAEDIEKKYSLRAVHFLS